MCYVETETGPVCVKCNAGLLFYNVFHSYRFKNEIDILDVDKMSQSGTPDSVQLTKKPDVNKCVLCQKVKDGQGNKKLTETADGQRKIIDTSKQLKDNILSNLSKNELKNIKYYARTCYASYLMSKRKRRACKRQRS